MAVVTGTATVNLSFTENITSGFLGTNKAPLSINNSTNANFNQSGTGAGQADTGFGKPIILVASTPQIFDLTNLVDQFNATNDFARARGFAILNPETNAAHILTVYRGASNGWLFLPDSTHALSVQPNGGILLLFDPNSTGGGNGYVTGGSSKTFTLDPGSNGMTVNLLIIGGSVA